MSLLHRLAFPVLLVAACSSSAPSTTPAPDAEAPRNEEPQEPEPEAPQKTKLLGACKATTECADGTYCAQWYPGGLCTKKCTKSEECGSDGACVPYGRYGMLCMPACKITSRPDCGPTGYCFPRQTGVWSCYPSCSPTDPAAACSTNNCDPYRGSCTGTASGAEVGAPCSAPADCKGICLTEGDATFVGYVGGMCTAYVPRPGQADYRAGQPLPQGRCPRGSVTIPDDQMGPDYGDIAFCYTSCSSDGDCRAGYACQKEVQGKSYSVGGCMPLDCNQPDKTCPTGYSCKPDPFDAAVGRCTKDS